MARITDLNFKIEGRSPTHETIYIDYKVLFKEGLETEKRIKFLETIRLIGRDNIKNDILKVFNNDDYRGNNKRYFYSDPPHLSITRKCDFKVLSDTLDEDPGGDEVYVEVTIVPQNIPTGDTKESATLHGRW